MLSSIFTLIGVKDLQDCVKNGVGQIGLQALNM